jgi:hypothetical protein
MEDIKLDKRGAKLQKQADTIQASINELSKSHALAVQEFTSRGVVLNVPKIEVGKVTPFQAAKENDCQ